MVAPLTSQANPLRAQSAWNLSAPSGGALKLGSAVLPKTYARPGLDVRWLGELVDLISGIGLGAAEHRETDILGRVYEYFLGRFASAEAKGGGKFYTPRSVVKLLVEMIEPYSGTTR
jgi:type I restriction-modification system DNA methylase subunit